MKLTVLICSIAIALVQATKPACESPTDSPTTNSPAYPTTTPHPSSISPTMIPTPNPTPLPNPTQAPTQSPTQAPVPGQGVPILVNLAVPDHVGVDCPGIQGRWPAGTLFCGSPKPPGANIYTPSCDEKMTVTYQGKSVTCVISFQAAGTGLTTGAYVELVPEAYAVLTGSTQGGQITGATCTGVCNVARA